MAKLSEQEIQEQLSTLDGWSFENGKLHKAYRFGDFVSAFGFMATSALMIEKRNHHPEWFNVYNRVVVDLTTHDEGGVSEKDVALARDLDGVARRFQ